MVVKGNKSLEQEAKEKAFEGLTVRIGELQRRDGEITEAVRQSIKGQNQGVILTLATPDTDENYLNMVYRGRYENKKQRRILAKAFAFCNAGNIKRGRNLLVNIVAIDSAGDNGALRHETGDMLTHQSIAFQDDFNKKGKREKSKPSNSPLST